MNHNPSAGGSRRATTMTPEQRENAKKAIDHLHLAQAAMDDAAWAILDAAIGAETKRTQAACETIRLAIRRRAQAIQRQIDATQKGATPCPG